MAVVTRTGLIPPPSNAEGWPYTGSKAVHVLGYGRSGYTPVRAANAVSSFLAVFNKWFGAT